MRLILLSLTIVVSLLGGCASVHGGPDLDSVAFMRTSQQRSAVELSKDDAHYYAVRAVPFARVATHVYCQYHEKNDSKQDIIEDCATFPAISKAGWVELYDWREVLTDDDKQTGLEFMAFGRASSGVLGDIIIGFRGTDFTSLSDWRSNLRWFTRFLPLPGKDQYQVVHSRSTELIDLALSRAKEKFPSASGFEVYTTGHSLGGGLATLLAFSDYRVKGAVVFDPSPVTGYSTLVTNSQVNCSARIVRIYERGEALQYVRSVLRHFYSLSANITEISFDLLHARGNPIANHSMADFRGGLEARADVRSGTPVPVRELPGQPDCLCYRDRHPDNPAAEASKFCSSIEGQ